jgi:hypothetical protein
MPTERRAARGQGPLAARPPTDEETPPLMESRSSIAPEAALILPVPEAEPVVGELRGLYDPSAAVGVPAHITINYPFKPQFTRPDAAGASLTSLISGLDQFRFTLSEIRRFPGVIYLAPEPAERIVDLITLVVATFPDSPPYGGQFSGPIPHLTVAQLDDSALSPIESHLAAHLARTGPIHALARELWLMDNAESQWKIRAIFTLKPSESRSVERPAAS